MNHGQLIRRLGFPLLLVSAVIAGVAPTSGPAGAAEEKASPDTVSAGLQKIQDMAAGSAGAVGKDDAKAEQLHAGIEPEWEKIEDTVRSNDSSAYVALEDSFTLLKIAAKAADPSKAEKASDGLSAAVDSYLSKHPGNAAPAERTAAAEPSTASAAPAEGSAAAEGSTAAAGTLARTGSGSDALNVLAGTALGLGGLAVMGGARRRTRRAS